MEKLELIRNYYMGDEEAEFFPLLLDSLRSLKLRLIKESLISPSFNLNSLYRVVVRCYHEVRESFGRTYIELGINRKTQEDYYFWFNHFSNYPVDSLIILNIDWTKIILQVFKVKKESPEKDFNDIIPPVVCEMPECTLNSEHLNSQDKLKISVSEFLAFISAIFREKVETSKTAKALFQIIIEDHEELSTRLRNFSMDDQTIKIMSKVNDLKKQYCSKAPLYFEGLITTIFASVTYTGLPKGEKLLRDQGFDKVWFRRRKALLSYMDYMGPAWLVSNRGLGAYIGIYDSEIDFLPSQESLVDPFILREFEMALELSESSLRDDRKKIPKDKTSSYYKRSVRSYNLARYKLLTLNYDIDFCREYFINTYRYDAPSDWFDEVTT